MLASMFDECMSEIVACLHFCAALHYGSDAILSLFEKAAWHKGF